MYIRANKKEHVTKAKTTGKNNTANYCGKVHIGYNICFIHEITYDLYIWDNVMNHTVVHM